MSQFTGRQTDSHGMSRDRDGRITADSKLQGTPKASGNKGVMAMRREEKREQAEERNTRTLPERRSSSAFKHRRLPVAA